MKEVKYRTFANNLNYFMSIHNVDRNKLCHDLNLNYTTVREWTNGTAFPRYDKIDKLASYFEIPKSDLIEDNKTKSILNSKLRNELTLENYIQNLATSELQKELLVNALMLSEKYASIINTQMIYYLEKQKEEEIQEKEEYQEMMKEIKDK